ncbi:hypothetical protein EWH08_13015 [Sphingobium indicum]|uniref:REDY-like protein HapK n=1 Tax=Sphingobium indicum TaxID=332055 RepID=A0A4V1WA25_9SPHN|nr:hypothetical protein [Sphingobium indicum]NYI23552.1 hypothetical protein [Sphingobium indicum]RYM01587.1 hypothetical protein EWH08_13015 [Sphingobium indicum]
MPRYIAVALTNPVEGKEAEFNHWYDTIAIPSYRKIPGLVPLGRFRHHSRGDDSDMPTYWKYASFYEIETDDFDGFVATVKKTLDNIPEYHLSEFLDRKSWFEPVYEALSGDAK